MKQKAPIARKLTFGFFYLLSSSIATVGLNVVLIGFTARALGVEKFGLYSAILSFVGLFQFLSDFGLNKTLLKFGSISRANAQVSFGNALLLKGILFIPTFLLVTLLGYIVGYKGDDILILELLALAMVLNSYGMVFSSIRRILGDFKLVSFFRVLKTLINLFIVIIALSINNSVLYLALATMLLNLITFIISLINSVLLLRPKLKLELVKDFFKDSIIFSFSDFFLSIYAKISIVLLSFLSDLHTVGIFSAAIKFTNVATLFPNQVRIALLPTLYRIMESQNIKESGDRKRVFRIVLKYMVVLAIPFVISVFLFSAPIMHLIFGEKYNLSIPFVKLFSLFIFFRIIQTPFSLFYIAMHKHKQMVYFQAVVSSSNLILNLCLIPKYSAYGATVATVISEGLLLFGLVFLGKRYLVWDLKDVFLLIYKPILSGCVSFALFYGLLQANMNLFLQIALLLLSYLLLLFLIKGFNKEDKDLFVKVFLKKNM